MEKSNNYCVILAGGIGSRFWPESRKDMPKQFLDVLGTGYSLIQATFMRIQAICPNENIYVVSHESYKHLIREHLPELPEENIVSEPFRKNTAPAAAYITYKIFAQNPDANLAITPADHLIINEQKFIDTVNKGLDYSARHKVIITLGIRPTRADTGYGYIQYETKENEDNIHKVITFTEKPDLNLARTFLKSGDFLWNSGIYIWNVNTFIEAFRAHLSEMAEVFDKGLKYFNTEEEEKVIQHIYSQCSSVSIDYGITEKVNNAYTIPSNFGWNDLGTWESAYEHAQKDKNGNALNLNNALIVDSAQNFIKSSKEKLVVVQGLHNYIIVDTEKVLLICERSKEQEIKNYVAEIKKQYGDKYI